MKRETFNGPYSLVDSISIETAPRQRARKGRSSKSENRAKSLSQLRKDAAEQIDRLIQLLDLTDSYVQTELEDDPGGNPEEVNEDGDGNPDDEPSLGWPEEYSTSGRGGRGSSTDLEEGQFVDMPKRSTQLDSGLVVENSYRRFVHGLTPEQKDMMHPRLDPDSWVLLR